MRRRGWRVLPSCKGTGGVGRGATRAPLARPCTSPLIWRLAGPSDVLILADDFDRALDAMPKELAGTAWIEGVTAIDRKLRGLLESEGVRPIEVLGAQFDPREHEAITSVGGTGRPDGEVVAEIQRGYRIRDRVLRPALVAVAAGSAAGSETGSSTDSAAGSGAGSEAAQTSGPNGRSADGSPTNG